MIVAEIGLNHLGNERKLNKYFKNLKLLKGINAITIQIREKNFYCNNKNLILNKNIYKKFFFKAKFFFLVGIAISDKKKIKLIKFYDLNFVKILSKDFTNYNFVKSVLLLQKETYLSIGNHPFNVIKKYFNLYKKINKNIKLIYTCFENRYYKLDLKKIKTYRMLLKTSVSYGNHHIGINKIMESLKYKPDSIFFYIKDNDNNTYPDNEHAVKLDELDKMLRKINEFRLRIK